MDHQRKKLLNIYLKSGSLHFIRLGSKTKTNLDCKLISCKISHFQRVSRIQRLNHSPIVSTPDQRVLGLNPNYIYTWLYILGTQPHFKALSDLWVIEDEVQWLTSSKRDCLQVNVVDQSWCQDSQIFPWKFSLYNTLSVDQVSRSDLIRADQILKNLFLKSSLGT